MTPFPTPQPWEAADPLPVMRRELKLLLIELNVLRVEVEQLRAMRGEAHAREVVLSTSIQQLTESRDQWRGEAERLYALIEQVPPWSLFWQRLMDAFRAWRNPTDHRWYCAQPPAAEVAACAETPVAGDAPVQDVGQLGGTANPPFSSARLALA